MSASSASGIVISEDSLSEQEDIRKATRMTLKEVQNVVGTLKENVLPRKVLSHAASKDMPLASTKCSEPTEPKRSKMVEQTAKGTQTTLTEERNLTADTPDENYWMKVAEKRRVALEETLDENAALHMKIAQLNDELESSEQMISHLRSLVETISEMLTESEEAKSTETKQEDDSGLSHSFILEGNDD